MTRIQQALEKYDNKKFGPLLGVSDEGSAAPTIAQAAYESAKAQAVDSPDAMTVGMIIDGERMGSAGELPIGPDEYQQILPAADGRTFCTTNVGVRVNTRFQQPLPEFIVAEAQVDEAKWVGDIHSKFQPFMHTPDGNPRPLTVRLLVQGQACLEAVRELVSKIEAGRADGRLGPPDLHRLSFLIEFEDEIREDDIAQIQELAQLAAELGVPEVAIDAKLVEAARRRISVQGLLNVLSPGTTRELLQEAHRRGVQLVYRFDVDQDSAARTIWTGLNSAAKFGLTAAKYGLFPLRLEQQKYVIEQIQRWMADSWTPIPAFYVDTPLVTNSDVFEEDRTVDAAYKWMEMIAAAGVKVALVDAPDRIVPRRLLKGDGGEEDLGVLSLDQIETLVQHAESLGLKVLWSGGIRPQQAFELAKLGVAGIFTTSSTARPTAVHGAMLSDIQLASQKEPTDLGVRRIHALIQSGYLCHALNDKQLAQQIEDRVPVLLESGITDDALRSALSDLNQVLVSSWKMHWS